MLLYTKIICTANYSTERMDCKNSVYSLDLFLACGPTQNENKVQKKNLYMVFDLSVFGSATVGLIVMSLGQRLGTP